MRYAFHGKMRMTGQEVDGYVDAISSSDAIDRLADQGIIGVYTVRPEPLPPKNAITLTGNAPAIVDLPQMVTTLTQEVARRSVAPLAESGALISLVEKLTTLVGQVEKILARPMPVYSGPVRESNGAARAKRPSNELQNNALKAIFETNLDLRKSLVKLGSTAAIAAPVAASSSPTGASRSSSTEIRPSERPASGRENGHAVMPRPATPRGLAVHA